MPEPLRRTVRLTTPPGDVNTVHDFLVELWPDVDTVSNVDRISIETALIELAANVMQHADSDGSGLTCEFTIVVSDDAIEMVVRDTGEPGEIQLVGAEMPELDAESGRGLALISALVDEVAYAQEGGHNVWRLKRARTTGA
jgi:serine/threonine-protein kinase RsbW